MNEDERAAWERGFNNQGTWSQNPGATGAERIGQLVAEMTTPQHPRPTSNDQQPSLSEVVGDEWARRIVLGALALLATIVIAVGAMFLPSMTDAMVALALGGAATGVAGVVVQFLVGLPLRWVAKRRSPPQAAPFATPVIANALGTLLFLGVFSYCFWLAERAPAGKGVSVGEQLSPYAQAGDTIGLGLWSVVNQIVARPAWGDAAAAHAHNTSAFYVVVMACGMIGLPALIYALTIRRSVGLGWGIVFGGLACALSPMLLLLVAGRPPFGDF